MGFPELGSVSLAELESLRGKLDLPVECDMPFTARYPMSVYAEVARPKSVITLDAELIRRVD